MILISCSNFIYRSGGGKRTRCFAVRMRGESEILSFFCQLKYKMHVFVKIKWVPGVISEIKYNGLVINLNKMSKMSKMTLNKNN